MKASIHPRGNADGTTSYRVRWRQRDPDGVIRQKTKTLVTPESAERFRINIEKFGPAQALAIAGVQDAGHTETLRDAIDAHIAALTGVEDGTVVTYKRYRDIDMAEIGALPLSAISETVVAAWIAGLQMPVPTGKKAPDGTPILAPKFSGKTVSNKHGFLAAVLNRAVRDGKIPTNPCDRTRLPRKDANKEPTFLTRGQFAAILELVPVGWRPLVRWLVATGMRFGEATALQVGDIDPDDLTVKIRRAWKYTGTSEPKLSYPKSKAGRRTINIPATLLADLDLSRPADAWLFPDPDRGGRVTYPKFRHTAWKNAVKELGIRATPHDLRHTCASWMLKAGVPIHVVQAHLGHESVTVTVSVYGHVDRESHQQAAAAVGAMLD